MQMFMRILLVGILAFIFVMGLAAFFSGYFMLLATDMRGLFLFALGVGLFAVMGLIYYGAKRIATRP